MENIFYQRLRALTHNSGKSFNQIERDLGYTRNALANYKNGGDAFWCKINGAGRLF